MKDKTKFEKIVSKLTIILSLIVITLSILGMLKINDSHSIVVLLLGVITLLNGLVQYKSNKKTAMFMFGVFAYSFITSIILLVGN